jgi:hypothetical protein
MNDSNPAPQVEGPVDTTPVWSTCGGPPGGGSSPISSTGRVYLRSRVTDETTTQQIWANSGTTGTSTCSAVSLSCIETHSFPAHLAVACASTSGYRLVTCATSGSEATQLYVPQFADTHAGVLLWGDSANATDTGNEVCALAGMTCVDIFTPLGVSATGCADDQGAEGTYFYALCRRT